MTQGPACGPSSAAFHTSLMGGAFRTTETSIGFGASGTYIATLNK